VTGVLVITKHCLLVVVSDSCRNPVTLMETDVEVSMDNEIRAQDAT